MLREINAHLLCADHLLMDPEYIFWEDGTYFFCYYPGGQWNVWEGFHRMTESFVQWTDFRDDASVRTSFLLHKETMKENYSLHKIVRQIKEIQEEAKRKWERGTILDGREDQSDENTTGSQSRRREAASCGRRRICGDRCGNFCADTKSLPGGSGMGFL